MNRFGVPEGAGRELDNAMDVLRTAKEGLGDRSKVERKLDELVDRIHRYDVEGLGAGEAAKGVVYEKAPLDHLLEASMTFPTDPQLKPKAREKLQATASQLPLYENTASYT